MLAPYAEQRHAMIDLCGLPQASAGLSAAPLLQPLEDTRIVARRRPKIPGNHAGGVPYGVAVRAAIPQVGHLPVQQSVKVELIINLIAAKALGVTFPLTLLGRADEVIE